MILLQILPIQSHPSQLTVRDQDTLSISSHSITSYTPFCQRPWYCFNISTFNPILHTYLSETMILFQYLHIQPYPSHPAVRHHDTASISPHSIPSYTPICQRPGYCFNISTFNPIRHTPGYCFNISTINPILHIYLSETMILLQYIHIQSHPTPLSVRDQNIVSISPHSIPSFTPIIQRPWCCSNISIFNPTQHTYLSETRILLQYLHNQSHPSHLSVTGQDTASMSPHSIPSYTPIRQRPWYCFNISTFNPILHTYLSETRILLQYLHIQLSYTPICQIPLILLQYLHIQSHPTHLCVRDQDTASISPHSIPSYTHICQKPWCCFNISTFNPILHTYLSETRILLQYLHIQSHPTHLSRSRRSLTTDAAKILIEAYVMSKIDYCKGLLYGIPDKLLNRIQRIQNCAAWVVLRLHKFSHITSALATLHWLPVNRRIDFKVALLVYKALNGQAPAYIADLMQPYDPPWKLRSADKQLLLQPPCRLKS